MSPIYFCCCSIRLTDDACRICLLTYTRRRKKVFSDNKYMFVVFILNLFIHTIMFRASTKTQKVITVKSEQITTVPYLTIVRCTNWQLVAGVWSISSLREMNFIAKRRSWWVSAKAKQRWVNNIVICRMTIVARYFNVKNGCVSFCKNRQKSHSRPHTFIMQTTDEHFNATQWILIW